MAESGETPHTLQRRWLVIAGLVVLALIFLIPFFRDGGAKVDTRVEMETKNAVVGSIQEITSGTGKIIRAETHPVAVPYTGQLSEINVKNGDAVSAGDVLATYDSDDLDLRMDETLKEIEELDDQIEELGQSVSFEITAPEAGLVKAVNVQRGDATDAGELGVLSTDGLLRVSFEIQDDQEIEKDDEVRVILDGHKAEGTVESVEDDTVTVTFPDKASYELGIEAEVKDEKGKETLGTGQVEANAPVSITCERKGVLSQCQVKVGDTVEEDDCLFACVDISLDESCEQLVKQRKADIDLLVSLRAFRQQPEITAPYDGVVTDLDFAAEDQVENAQQLCTLTSQRDYVVSVSIPLRDSDRVREGQTAQLAFENGRREGTVLGLDPEGSEHGVNASVLVRLEGVDNWKVGDEAQTKIILAQAEDAVLIPIQSVQVREDGSETVSVYYGDGLARNRGIITGLNDGTYVQVLQGLDVGEKVVVSSHLVETTTYSLLNFEWIVGEKEGPSENGLVTDGDAPIE